MKMKDLNVCNGCGRISTLQHTYNIKEGKKLYCDTECKGDKKRMTDECSNDKKTADFNCGDVIEGKTVCCNKHQERQRILNLIRELEDVDPMIPWKIMWRKFKQKLENR